MSVYQGYLKKWPLNVCLSMQLKEVPLRCFCLSRQLIEVVLHCLFIKATERSGSQMYDYQGNLIEVVLKYMFMKLFSSVCLSRQLLEVVLKYMFIKAS